MAEGGTQPGDGTELPSGAWALHLGGDGEERTLESRLRVAVSCAVLAPSNHNTQPWSFRVTERGVEIWADRSRGLPVVDPHDRELVISCGAALHHVTLALANLGLASETLAQPHPDEHDLLAIVTVVGSTNPSDDERLLFAQIPRRHTNRRSFERRAPPAALVSLLTQAAVAEQVGVHVIRGDPQRSAVARLIAEADLVQGRSPGFRDELWTWIDNCRVATGDGLLPGDRERPEPHEVPTTTTSWYWRTFELRTGGAAPAIRTADLSPALVLLTTEGDSVVDWLRTGRALSAVLLRARAAGVWASFLNQPVEVDHTRAELRRVVTWPAHPQLLIRLGYGPEPGPTQRRPVADVLVGPRAAEDAGEDVPGVTSTDG